MRALSRSHRHHSPLVISPQCVLCRRDTLVSGLSQVYAASAQTSATVPRALIADVVDQARSPDDFTAEQHAQRHAKGKALETKQQVLGRLADRIADDAADLLRPWVGPAANANAPR